jgi:hypothetical protein
MEVTLRAGVGGFDLLLVAEDGRVVPVQPDSDLPALARRLGFVACGRCRCANTRDGCAHHTAAEIAADAREWLRLRVDESFVDVHGEYFSVEGEEEECGS